MRVPFHPPPPPRPKGACVIGKPQWLAVPNAAEVESYDPNRAQRMVTGSATLQCIVRPDGGLGACAVLDDNPAEFGFGDAALQIAALLRVAPLDEAGQPVAGGVVRFPVKFTLPD